MARYYIIAGEASGDMHAANLMKQLIMLDPEHDFRFWGGDRMSSVGGRRVVHISELAFMGFWEVFQNLRTILGKIRFCKRDILEYRPDVLILVDYPGFNLRIAEFAHKQGIRVVYYISPQVWAWKSSRIRKIRRSVDKLLAILPFEEDFYRGSGVNVEFTGHPLLDEVIMLRDTEQYADFRKSNNLPAAPLIALLPGSRKQEISKMLGGMVSVAPRFKGCHFVVAAISNQKEATYSELSGLENVSVIYDQTYALLANSYAAIVTSGTATLETALFGVPQIVCYKANPVSYLIAKRLVKIDFISLVNLIMGREVIRELIQGDFNGKRLYVELSRLINDKDYRNDIKDAYSELESLLGGEGASYNAARAVRDLISD